MTTRTLADPPWLSSKPAMRVLELLNADGEEGRVVGGAVRNALLGLPVGELDLATTAVPDKVMKRAAAAHIKAVPTGVAHGTVTLVADGEAFEVTTLREDIETFGRKATVKFGRDWVRDAQRRDFTINGLSWARDGTVYDHVGGLQDIAARKVRFIGDALTRIQEDYLRILRFFRIHAAYGEGPPDAGALAACRRGRDGLAGLSAERVRVEMLKLLVAQGAANALDAMAESGLLVPLIGGVPYRATFRAMVEVERALGLTPDPMRRLAALAVSTTKDALHLASHLRLSNVELRALQGMAENWWHLAEADEAVAKAVLYRLDPPRYRDRAMLAFARLGGDLDTWTARITLAERWMAPKFPLKAAHFIARGIAEGPALGHVLALAEQAWIDAGFPMGTEAVAQIAERSVADFQRRHRL